MSKLTARHLSDCWPDFSTVYILSINTNNNLSKSDNKQLWHSGNKIDNDNYFTPTFVLKKESQFVIYLVKINPQKYGTKYIRLQMLWSRLIFWPRRLGYSWHFSALGYTKLYQTIKLYKVIPRYTNLYQAIASFTKLYRAIAS